MGAKRLVFITFILAVIIKNGFTKPDTELKQRFKSIFPKIMISSTSPPTVLNSTLSSNSTLENKNNLQNERLNDSASILFSKVIQPPFSSPPIDQQLAFKHNGGFGNPPDLSNSQAPFFINPFGWVPLFLAGPLNPLRIFKTVIIAHPITRIFNRIHSSVAVPPVPIVNPDTPNPDYSHPDTSNPVYPAPTLTLKPRPQYAVQHHFHKTPQGQSSPIYHPWKSQTTNGTSQKYSPFPSGFALHNLPAALQVARYNLLQKFAPGTYANFFNKSLENTPHSSKEASLAHKVPNQLLLGTHSLKNALQNSKFPSALFIEGSISDNQTLPGFIYSPPDLLPSGRNAASVNVSNEITQISDNETSLTSNSTEITVSKNITGTTNISDNIALNESVSFNSNLTATNQSQISGIPFPFERAYAPGTYYLAPVIGTKGLVQFPENSDQHNIQPSKKNISHQSTEAKQDSAGKKIEFEMEKGNLKPSDLESSNEAPIPNLQVAVADVSSLIDGDSKNQSLETSTVVSNPIFTSQIPEVSEKGFSESTKSLEHKHDIFKNQIYTTSSTSTTATDIVSKKSQEHRKSTNSIKVFTPFPFLRIKPKTKFTQINKSTATSTIATIALSQSEAPERLLFAQYLPSTIVGHANKTLKSEISRNFARPASF